MATRSDSVIQPDHIIIWCDRNMGKKENNKDSKAVLEEHGDVQRPPSPEYCDQIDRFISHISPYLNDRRFELLIKSPLRMFTDENECLKCINDSIEAKKHVFLITSGQTGAILVPQMHTLLSGRIYIFCAQRTVHEQWAQPYEKDIEIYDDDKGVFARVLADIGAYYMTKAGKTDDSVVAIQYCHWAQRLYISATKIDNNNRKGHLDYIRSMLKDFNAPPSTEYDNDIQMGQDAN